MRLIFLNFFMYVFLSNFVWAQHTCSTCSGQKRAMGILGLELKDLREQPCGC